MSARDSQLEEDPTQFLYDTIRQGEQLLHEIKKADGYSITGFLRDARNEGVEALWSLISAPADDPAVIRTLQNKVQRYLDLTTWVNKRLADMKNSIQELDEVEQRDIVDHLTGEFGDLRVETGAYDE